MVTITHARKSISRFFVASTMALFSIAAHALGGDGGCTYDKALMAAVAGGKPPEMSHEMEAAIARAWSTLPPDARTLLSSTPRAQQEWQAYARKIFLNESGGCGEEQLIDRAIRGGNLEIVKWLLDEGADPNGVGKSRDSVFDRCPTVQTGNGFDQAAADRQTTSIYRLLVARGADKNALHTGPVLTAPHSALYFCESPAMLQLLLDLGFDRSPPVDDDPVRYEPLQSKVREALRDPRGLQAVRVLAQNGLNDLRGTGIEAELYRLCRTPKLEENCRLLEPLLHVSPGIWPSSIASLPEPPSDAAFGVHRETCSFPEILFQRGSLELAVVSNSQDLKTGLAFRGDPHEVRGSEIIVNSPSRPVLVYLESNSPRLWLFRYTPGTRILGVVYSRSAEGVITGLDPSTPVAHAFCNPIPPWASPLLLPRNPDSLDPFERGRPFKIYDKWQGPTFIGDPLTPDALKRLTPVMPANPGTLGLEHFPGTTAPLQGLASIEEMVADGQMRRANAGDFLQWVDAMHQIASYRRRMPTRVPPFWDAYVNLESQLKLPAGLRGPNAPILFTPADTDLVGDIGDATIFFVHGARHGTQPEFSRWGTCKGPQC